MCGLAGIVRLSIAALPTRRTFNQAVERSGRRGLRRCCAERDDWIGLARAGSIGRVAGAQMIYIKDRAVRAIFDERIFKDRDRRHGPKHAGYCLWAGADAV
jgi:hypothetical protein